MDLTDNSFCEIGRGCTGERPIKSLDFFKLGRAVTLNDCMEFMITEGVFTDAELEAALIAIQDGHHEPVPSGLARTVEVVMGFKAVGG